MESTDIRSKDYRYKAFTRHGWEVGYVSANNKLDAINISRRMFDRVISINRCWVRLRARSADVIDWFTALSMFMKEGVKIEDALELIAHDKQYVFSLGMLELIKSGYSFAETMLFYEFFFDKESIMVMKSMSNIIPIQNICDFIIEYKKRSQEKYDAIKKSLLQPCLVICFTLITCLAVTLFLKDSIEVVFMDLKIPLPPLLEIINSLDLIRILSFIACIILTCYLVKKNFSRLPFVREYFMTNDTAIVFYFIGMSLRNGVSIIDAIKISSHAPRTKFMKKFLETVRESIIQGNSVFNSCKDLNVVYNKIIRVSEISGNLSEGFLSVSEIAAKDLSKRLIFFEKSLSPFMTVIAGMIILFFLKTFIFPMYECISSTVI